MRSLPIPDRKDGLQFRAVFRHYASLKNVSTSILKAYRTYIESKAQGLVPIPLSSGQVEDLERAYANKPGSAGLAWIKELHNGHSLNYCPLCGGPGCRTIDHHLPDASYPEFSIFSKNLVPSCSTCNPKRNNSNKADAKLLTLSPYFDGDLLDSIKLITRVLPPYGDPVFELTFRSETSGDTSESRIKNHIDTSVDIAAFKTWTRGQWSDIYSQRASRHETFAGFREELEYVLRAETIIGNGNSWNAALVRGMLLSPESIHWMIDNPLILRKLTPEELGLV